MLDVLVCACQLVCLCVRVCLRVLLVANISNRTGQMDRREQERLWEQDPTKTQVKAMSDTPEHSYKLPATLSFTLFLSGLSVSSEMTC